MVMDDSSKYVMMIKQMNKAPVQLIKEMDVNLLIKSPAMNAVVILKKGCFLKLNFSDLCIC